MNTRFRAQTTGPAASGRAGKSDAERACGIVENIDLISRDLRVLLQAGIEVFDIPPDCPILLHGERIKLRLVQPRDQVWITFQRTPKRLIAQQLEVQPDHGFHCFRL